MSAPRVLVVRAGEAEASVQAAHGDYPAWFAHALAPHATVAATVAPFRGEPLPAAPAVDAVLVTGSPLSVRDGAPWMPALGAWTLAQSARLPVLAVCFGHQLVAEALGGRVEAHPGGPEWGTVAVDLHPEGRADPLFAGLPRRLIVQGLHRDHVATLPPPGALRPLAGNAHTPLQAFAVGPNLRAVQFHPELRAPVVADLLARRDWAPTAPVRQTDHGERILANWARGLRAAPLSR